MNKDLFRLVIFYYLATMDIVRSSKPLSPSQEDSYKILLSIFQKEILTDEDVKEARKNM